MPEPAEAQRGAPALNPSGPYTKKPSSNQRSLISTHPGRTASTRSALEVPTCANQPPEHILRALGMLCHQRLARRPLAIFHIALAAPRRFVGG